jgi:hypothetical protein
MKMNCADFENVVHELARDDAREVLGEATEVMGRFHAETCEACAARLAEARALSQALKEVAEDSSQWEAPGSLEASLMTAFREYHRSLERTRYRARRTRLRSAEWMAVGVAAVGLLAVGAWNFSRGHADVKPNVVKTNSSPTATNTTPLNAGGTRSPAPLETATAEDSDFVPLPYSEGLSADEPGLVVRVSMPRSALRSLGYPVDEMNGAEVIQADLVVGEDGWPHAVRLVQ